MSILREIGLTVRTKFGQDKESDDKKMSEVEENFNNQTNVYLPGEYSEDVRLINEEMTKAFSETDKSFEKYSADLVKTGENIKNLLSDDGITNVFAELDELLTKEGEELNNSIAIYNEELNKIASEREAEFGFEDTVVIAAITAITTAYA